MSCEVGPFGDCPNCDCPRCSDIRTKRAVNIKHYWEPKAFTYSEEDRKKDEQDMQERVDKWRYQQWKKGKDNE